VKPAIRSALAAADVEEAVELYFAESAPLALRFVSALERAVRQIEAHPESGSPRYAHELNLPQLRFWPLHRFPHALFYIEHADHLDVIRCVHMRRDMPASLREDTASEAGPESR
jgi:toxin ParE1/3/4